MLFALCGLTAVCVNPQGPGMGQQGRGGGFADPNDVEVNLEGQGGGWGEADDILTYVQSKVRQHVCKLNVMMTCNNNDGDDYIAVWDGFGACSDRLCLPARFLPLSLHAGRHVCFGLLRSAGQEPLPNRLLFGEC